MREILFRGYNKIVKRWYYGYLVKFDNLYYIRDGSGTEPFAEEDSIGQYTGYVDKNGNKIFDGDIAIWNDNKLEIKFEDGCWQGITINPEDEITLTFTLDGLNGIEVVGNVYEEKLKESKNDVNR